MRARIEAADLIDAAESFLRQVEGELEGRLSFHAKVAANALAIAAREARLQPAVAEAAAFAAIGASPAEACDRILSGEWTVDTPGLLDAIEAAIIARLAVDNPKFPTLRRLRER